MKNKLVVMQIGVPHSKFGYCEYFMPKAMGEWLWARKMDYNYSGSNSWGDGYTNGVSNRESIYIIREVQKEDGLMFKLTFSECKVIFI